MAMDDHIRLVFGLDDDDPLPDADEDALWEYHDYLTAHLSFPFDAEHTPTAGQLFPCSYRVKIVGLCDSDEVPVTQDGIHCDARKKRRRVVFPLNELEVPEGEPNHELLEGYCNWFGDQG